MRFHDWPEKLDAYIAERRDLPFAWGKGAQDCCSFAAGAVLAQTGVDPMATLPDYADAAEADLVIGEQGLAPLLDERFPRRRSPGLMQRGDVCVALIKGRESVLVCIGAEIVGPGARGLVFLPRAEALIAWAV